MGTAIAGSSATALELLLEKVYKDSSYDFRQYRQGTVIRRLDRRLRATGSRTYLDYMRFLDIHPQEYQRLNDYLTIHVSSFFRNADAFQQLAGRILPDMVNYKKKHGQRSLSFWSAACASGEEPYSIAIMLIESLGQGLPEFDISINATDISRQALNRAQSARYRNTEGLSSTLMERYFDYSDDCYTVKDKIRRTVEFSYFNLLSKRNPFFTGVDFVFCCNIFIYMQKQLQERVLNLLYKSLAVPGYLILGEAETLTENLYDKLECLDARAKIYKKNDKTV